MSEEWRPIIYEVGSGAAAVASARFSFFPSQEGSEEALLLLNLTDEVRVVFRVPLGENHNHHYDLVQRGKEEKGEEKKGEEVGLRPWNGEAGGDDGWYPGIVISQTKEINLGAFPTAVMADEAEPRVFLEGFVEGNHVRVSGCRSVLVADGLEGYHAFEAMEAMVQRIAEFLV